MVSYFTRIIILTMGSCFSQNKTSLKRIQRVTSICMMDVDSIADIRTSGINTCPKKNKCRYLARISIRQPLLIDPKLNPLYISHVNRRNLS